jgi:large subunit ribosomal protein L30e
MDLNKAIRMAVDTGKAELGADRSVKNALNARAKAIVVAKNCPKETRQDLVHYARMSNVPVIEFSGGSIELGVVCGKPFPISAMSVLEEGNSDILKAVEKEKRGRKKKSAGEEKSTEELSGEGGKEEIEENAEETLEAQ